MEIVIKETGIRVSTHSHLKVAANIVCQIDNVNNRFNTQPPEGGCISSSICKYNAHSFNTQPPEGGCNNHSHSPVANYSFNTQPPEGGCVKKSKDC